MAKKATKPRPRARKPWWGSGADPLPSDPLEEGWQKMWGSFSASERAYLEHMFEVSRTGLAILGDNSRSIETQITVFRTWVERILDTDVEIKRAGRARVKRHDLDYALEVQWVRGADGIPKPKSITVVGDPYLTDLDPIPHHEHLVALAMRLRNDQPRKFRRMPTARPAPGEPPKTTFYAGLVELYEALLKDGHPSPALEIAERLGENHSTVKVWLHRGRKYLAEIETKKETSR